MRHKKNFTHALASILLAIATAAGCSGGGGTGSGGESKPTPAASRIDAISPSSARPGEQVTLTGVGFGAQNVAVEVGGADAHVVSATGTRVVFEVPSGLARGPTLVTASNPGERVGQIAFTVLEGILLPGDPNALAVDAVFSLPPTPVDDSEIQNGFIMTRLDVHLRPDATVADVNAALQRVGGGIVTMLARYPAMTIAIPVAADLGALTDAARTLRGSRGVLFADVGRVPAPKRLPPGEAGAVGSLDQLTHLLAARFPAAWNVSALATEGCASRKVTVLVADRFGGALIGDETNFVDEVPGFVDLGPEHSGTELHGYEVTTTLAALFDDANPTGANPFTDCLMVESFDVSRFTPFETLWLLPTMFPSDKFVLNFSLGFDDRCKHSPDLVDDACTPDQVDTLGLPLARAVAAADWKALTADRQADFLVAVAGGNEADKAGTAIYPGLGRAYFSSAITVAALPDPSFTFVQDGASWDPHAQPAPGGFPSMTATDDEAQALQLYLQLIGADALGPADNVLVVGSTTEPGTNGLVGESAFSDSAPDVMAVGETIPVLAASGLALADGTSFAAPQVGGLASYLWLLGRGIAAADPAFPDLSALPSAVTRQAILSNAQQAGLDTGAGLIDAYAATLSLDAATRPTPSSAPVRLKLLNVDTSGASAARFDEADVADFLAHLFAKDADGNFLLDANGDPLEPSAPDYGRYDLNGDGFTGGSRHARFDLDRVGSTQFGAAQYSAIAQDIDGDVAGFDESALTDVDILCYYAFSDLYEGDQALRHELFSQLPANHGCLRVDVTIDPASVTLTAGASRQFAATVTGASDPRVTWSVSGGGTIDTATGLFTADSAAG
ncbi:MAG TPA: S8 family serine peptidase, partial [Gammaproteobacteria bacterium]|nr:S8 family serine peptidase [Gammaproteobacteria bacterium]